MTWVNLDDIYLPLVGGGVIDGDLTVNGDLTAPTINAIKNIVGKAYKFTSTVTLGSNYSSAEVSCYLVGNNMRFYMYATRSSASGTGNITNETVCSVSVNTDNKVSGIYTATFVAGTEGGLASFYTRNCSTTDGVISFDVTLCATGTSSSAWSTYWSNPVVLNVSAYS